MRPVVCPTSPHLTPSPCISAQQISTILGAAVPEERENSAWTEGVAIWVAVLVVSLVGGWPRCGALALLAASCDRPCPCVCNPKALPGVLPVPLASPGCSSFSTRPCLSKLAPVPPDSHLLHPHTHPSPPAHHTRRRLQRLEQGPPVPEAQRPEGHHRGEGDAGRQGADHPQP